MRWNALLLIIQFGAVFAGGVAHAREALMAEPQSPVVTTGGQISLSARLGVPPYRFRVISGEGYIEEATGLFQAPRTTGSTAIRISDSAGHSVETLVLINPPLELEPPEQTVVSGEGFQFAVSGGAPPYRFALKRGNGTIHSDSGLFTAASAGEALIEVTDAVGGRSEARVHSKAALALTPSSLSLTVEGQHLFSAEGGLGPLKFSLLSGVGKIDEAGNYSAGSVPGTAVIQVSDSSGLRRTSSVSVLPRLAIHPSSKALVAGETSGFVVKGGHPPYHFALKGGKGRIDSTGRFTAPVGKSDGVVIVTDSLGNSASSVLTVSADTLVSRTIASGYAHTCAVIDGAAKCWGQNSYGQLGSGIIQPTRRPTQVLGLDKDVLAVATGFYHSCAILVGGGVKCWGDNRLGQLGNHSRKALSAWPLPVEGLDEGVTAISAGQYHTCVIKGGAVLCWGDNRHGQLGDGTRKNRGFPSLVNGLTEGAESVGAGSFHSCAAQNGSVKCWGENSVGQLGNGLHQESLLPVAVANLPPEIRAIDAKGSHSCAVYSGGIKCWGYNGPGQIGDHTTENRHLPRDVEGIHSDIVSVSLGATHSCAVLEGGGEVKCWGHNFNGQLGEDTSEQYRTVPASVPGVPPGVKALASGNDHTCALTADSVWCWGSNREGQFGNGGRKSALRPVRAFGLKD